MFKGKKLVVDEKHEQVAPLLLQIFTFYPLRAHFPFLNKEILPINHSVGKNAKAKVYINIVRVTNTKTSRPFQTQF